MRRICGRSGRKPRDQRGRELGRVAGVRPLRTGPVSREATALQITGMVALSFLAGGLGIAGLAFMAIGLFAPHAVHLM